VGNILAASRSRRSCSPLDAFGVRGSQPLTYRAAWLVLVLEGLAVVAVLAIVVGTQLPGDVILFRVTPEELLIAVLWVVSLLLIQRADRGLPWHELGEARDNQGGLFAMRRRADPPSPGRRTPGARLWP
jgi:cation:H+ antiporter